MRRTYLTVLTATIETDAFNIISEQPADRFYQNHVATYLGSVVADGMLQEDSRDELLDLRAYAVSVCVGKDHAAHDCIAIGRREGPDLIYWCKVCGAIKVNQHEWKFPETRIDRKEP